MADHGSVKLHNRSAHVKYLALGGGHETVAIPPREDGQAAVEVKFSSDDERAAFQRALETDSVKKWIEDGELVVDAGRQQPPSTSHADAPQQPAPQSRASSHGGGKRTARDDE